MAAYNSGVCSDAVARYGGAFIELWYDIDKNSPVTDDRLRSYIGARAAYMAHGGLWRICAARREADFAEQVAMARRLIRDHAWKLWREKADYSGKVRLIVCLCRYFYPLWSAAAKLSARGK